MLNSSYQDADDFRPSPGEDVPLEYVLWEDSELTEEEINANLMSEGLIDRNTGMGRVLEHLRNAKRAGGDVTGGDLDDNEYQAEAVGEEAVGGQNPTPDQNVTEDLLHSVGVDALDGEYIHTYSKVGRRDRRRWELNPESAEDYLDHE
ncbi:MAG: DUF6335 family protein [Cyanophyceae cyanobacterium]